MNSISQKSTNYALLKKDEQKVMTQFKNIFNKIILFFEDQIGVIQYSNNQNDLEHLFDNSLKEEKSILISIKDIQDECIWLIQKHEPRANHLRFLIAIINSLNDIKRISNYIVNFSKFFSKYYKDISAKLRAIIVDISRLCLNKTKSFYELINHENIIESECVEIFDDFLNEYKKQYLDFINQSTIEDNDSNLTATSIIIIKNIDRTIDHCVNIIENFININ